MAAAQMDPGHVLANDAAGQLSNESSDPPKVTTTGSIDAADIQVLVSEGQDHGDQELPSSKRGDECTTNKSKKSKSMQLQTSKSGVETVSVFSGAAGVIPARPGLYDLYFVWADLTLASPGQPGHLVTSTWYRVRGIQVPGTAYQVAGTRYPGRWYVV